MSLMSNSNLYLDHPLIKKHSIERRLYQETILASASEKNTLVILPTGLGKTLIAALLAAHRLSKLPDTKCIFLAPTKPLVMQHYSTFKSVMNIPEEKLIALTGEVKPSERAELWKKGIIFFTTPQILENDLLFKRTTITDVSLIIFDEAHRSVGDYPYPNIAKIYMENSKHPLILALTASPGSSPEKINEVCRNLYISNIEARDESSIDVKPYIVSTNISWIKLELPEEISSIKKELEAILKGNYDFLVKNNFISIDFKKFTSKKTMLELQAKLRELIDKREPGDQILLAASSILAESIRLSHALELVETQGLVVLKKYFDKLEKEGSRSGSSRAIRNLLLNPVIRKLRENVQKLLAEGLIHPKFHYIVKKVSEWLSTHPNSRVIVFCQYRELAMLLADTLNGCSNIKAKRFIGQATREGDKGISQKEQLQILEEFKAGALNVLVATSVAEEGLDISECDLVVFYDFAPSVIRYIQRKGRTGRRSPGNVLILLTKGTRDESYYWMVANRQKSLKHLIKHITPVSVNATRAQPTLEQYLENERDEPCYKVIVDHRELSSPIPRLLSEMGVSIIPEQLPAGDYVISEDVAVERKTASDFLQSLIDKRLFDQIIKLKEVYENPILIIEGESLYGLRNIHQNAIRGALASIVVDYNLPILWSRDADDTAKLIYAVVSRRQSIRDSSFSLKKGKLPVTISEIQERLISSLPQINQVLARRLLKLFKKPINIFNSSEEDLKKVSGIGEKKVKMIKEVLNTEYEE